MKTILHGDNLVASRNELVRIKAEYQGEIVNIDGKTAGVDEIKQALESLSLFSTNRLIVIENIFSRPSKKEIVEFMNYLSGVKTNFKVVLWENKEINAPILKKISPSWKIKVYKIPKLMFSFLESIAPANNQKMLYLIKILRKNNQEEFIYLMIVRQIRMLLLAKERVLKDMPSWMIGKLLRQARYFTVEKLLEIYKKLLMIDIGIKTGRSPFGLKEELDLLLSTI